MARVAGQAAHLDDAVDVQRGVGEAAVGGDHRVVAGAARGRDRAGDRRVAAAGRQAVAASIRPSEAANKVFKSSDRGDSWQVISPDLTMNADRNEIAIMGKRGNEIRIARNDGKTVFVEGGLTGETVQARIARSKVLCASGCFAAVRGAASGARSRATRRWRPPRAML